MTTCMNDACPASSGRHVALIPGRFFAFITVRRTTAIIKAKTRPGARRHETLTVLIVRQMKSAIWMWPPLSPPLKPTQFSPFYLCGKQEKSKLIFCRPLQLIATYKLVSRTSTTLSYQQHCFILENCILTSVISMTTQIINFVIHNQYRPLPPTPSSFKG